MMRRAPCNVREFFLFRENALMPHARQQAVLAILRLRARIRHASLRMNRRQLFAARLTLMPDTNRIPNKVYLMLPTAGWLLPVYVDWSSRVPAAVEEPGTQAPGRCSRL